MDHCKMPLTEEEEAMLKPPSADLKMFHASCEFLKSSVRNMKELKKEGKKNAAEIQSMRTDATVHFIHMKKLNRMAHFRCRKIREGTNEAKHRIDQCHLQLQNLLYEALHLQKEITKCMEFKSKDEEIELVPVEEFYKNAPESIANPETTQKDAHQQMLARLEWELEQRKQLSLKLTETQTSKEKISQEIQAKQDYLETLQPKLAAILEATRPVQDYLHIPYDAIKEEHNKAQYLSAPLYILYMQMSAYKEACDQGLKVTIQGDLEAAKAVSNVSLVAEEDSDSDQEEQEKPDSKRRRKTTEARQNEKKNSILKKHPLHVVMELAGEDGTCLHLTFHYLLMLNIVTVNVKVTVGSKVNTDSISGGQLLSPDLFLDELYPGHHGNDSPNMANHYELRRQGMSELSAYILQVGRPYLWCQWMGGLQFLEEDISAHQHNKGGSGGGEGSGSQLSNVRAKHTVSATHMQESIQLLRQRLQARLCLLQHVSSIERGILPISPESVHLFPAKINAHLSSWKQSTFEDLRTLKQAQRAIKAGIVCSSDFVFMASIDRGSAKMTAHVVISAQYPKVAPYFILDILWQSQRTALNDIHVMQMEEEVNYHYKELTAGTSSDDLLPLQLQRLLMCFDVYLETDTPASSAVPVEIPKEKMMPRTARGRARAKPYQYIPELGIFTHRT